MMPTTENLGVRPYQHLREDPSYFNILDIYAMNKYMLVDEATKEKFTLLAIMEGKDFDVKQI